MWNSSYKTIFLKKGQAYQFVLMCWIQENQNYDGVTSSQGNWIKNNLPLEKILPPLRIFHFHFILKFAPQKFSDFVS